MYFWLCNGKLDNIICKMDDVKIITNTSSIVKKGYLTSEEHFLEVLYHVINTINIDFGFVKMKNSIMELMIKNPKSYKLLLSKKYIGNNNYIPYYQLNFKKFCLFNFLEILNFVDKTPIIVHFFKSNNIDINNIKLNRKADVENLYSILLLICLCNGTSYGLYYIFEYKPNPKSKDICTIQLEMLIEKTMKIKDKAISFLEAIH